MHATIEQLLDINDGIENSMSQHVSECKQCRDELMALRQYGQQIGEHLHSVAQAPVPAGLWERIEASARASVTASETTSDLVKNLDTAKVDIPSELVAARTGKFSWNSLNAAVYTLAFSVLLTGFIGLFVSQQQGSVSQQQTQQLQASIDELMLNSRGLESVLQRVVEQNRPLNATERSVADRLYWRLTMVDQMIHDNDGSSNANTERVKMLWNDRINALNELNQLYLVGQEKAIGASRL